MDPKRLYLSKNKVIGGVCGGIAEYINVDPTIVRLLWVLLALTNGIGIVLYFLALFIIPEDPYTNANRSAAVVDKVRDSFNRVVRESSNSNARNFGIILIITGGLLILHRFIPHLSWQVIWSIILIILGLFLILRRS